MQSFYDAVSSLLGLRLEPKDLGFMQVGLRGIIVFLVSLVLVRLATRRFLAKMSALDAILGFILASMLARAVNGSAAFFPTLFGGFVLVGLHRLLVAAAYRWSSFGNCVKGRAAVLARHGTLDLKAMAANDISKDDLLEEARLNGQVEEQDRIKVATLERNGQVSVIPEKP